MLGKEVLTVDLCSLSAKNVQLQVFRSSTFEHVWCGLRLLQISGFRPSQSPNLIFSMGIPVIPVQAPNLLSSLVCRVGSGTILSP